MSEEEYIKSGNVIHNLQLDLVQQKVAHQVRSKKPFGIVLTSPLQYAVLADDQQARFGYFLDKLAFKPVITYGPRLTLQEYSNLKRILLAIWVPLVLRKVPLWPGLYAADIPIIHHYLHAGMSERHIAKLLGIDQAAVHEVRLGMETAR